MCRYIYADQVIGSIFIELLQHNKMEISLKDLFDFERKLDVVLRKANHTIISMSINDVYGTVANHARIFEIQNERLKLKTTDGNIQEIIELLDDYFRAGLPKDISETIKSQANCLARG